MHIKGLIKTSLLDYPGKLSLVLFTGGCNFRCPFCHNADIVLNPKAAADFPEAEVMDTITERRNFIDGVVITGGEPTLQPDLRAFIEQIRALGLPVKLDTNGYRPQLLKELLQAGLVDFVAMDVKSSLDTYAQAAGVDIDPDRITRSIDLILRQAPDYEFRTTVVPGLVGPDDVEGLTELLQGAKRYSLQQFRPEGVIDPALEAVTPYTVQTLQGMAAQLEASGIPTSIRGI